MTIWQSGRPGRSLALTNVHAITPVDAARNLAVEQFLKTDAEWLLQIDNDVVPPVNILELLDWVGRRKIVGLPCGFQQAVPGEIVYNIFIRRDGHIFPISQFSGVGWTEVEWVGSGCLLVHRDVFAAIDGPWFECAPVNGQYAREDVSFCGKARAKGFSIWTHSGFPCEHYKTVNQTGFLQVPK